MNSRLAGFFRDYASFHQTQGNQVCHYVGIPMIVLSLLGLLGSLPIAGGLTGSEYLRLDGGTLFWALGMLWYLRLDWRLGSPFALVTLGAYFIARSLPTPALGSLFIGGWIVQFLGHAIYEKKSPAFFKNGEHLLVGPFWLFAKLIRYQSPT